MKKQTSTPGIFIHQNPAAVLKPNYLFQRYKKNLGFKEKVENLVHVEERKDKKNRSYLYFTKKLTSESKYAKIMSLEIEKKSSQEYKMGEAHITLYQFAQYSDNLKKKNRFEGGHDVFSPYHVTTSLFLKNNKSHEVRLYCDYRGVAKIIVKKITGKDSQVVKKLPYETEKTLKVYLYNLFSDILYVLQNEVLIKEKTFLDKEKALDDYLKQYSEKKSLAEIPKVGLEKYKNKLRELSNLGKKLVQHLNFSGYQTIIDHFDKVSSFIEKEILKTSSVDQSDANNNQIIQKKENKSNPLKKNLSTSDGNISHNLIQKNTHPAKQTSEEWFLQEYKKIKHYKQKLIDSVVDNDKQTLESLLNDKEYKVYANQPAFLSDLFMMAIEKANKSVMIYLVEQFKFLKDYSKMPAFPGRNKPLIQLVFYLAVKNKSCIDIFDWLLKNNFYYSLDCFWKHQNDQGETTNLFPASLACQLNALDLLEPMFKSGDASLTPNVFIYLEIDQENCARYILPDPDKKNRGVLTFAAENLWFDALAKLYSLAPDLSFISEIEQQILKFTARYTSIGMILEFSKNYTIDGLNKIIILMGYLSDKKLIDFYRPTVAVSGFDKINFYNLAAYNANAHSTNFCNQVIFLAYPKLLELILNKQQMPNIDLEQLDINKQDDHEKNPLLFGIAIYCASFDKYERYCTPFDSQRNRLLDMKKVAFLLLEHFYQLPYEKARNIYKATTHYLYHIKKNVPLPNYCDNLLDKYIIKLNIAYYNIKKRDGFFRGEFLKEDQSLLEYSITRSFSKANIDVIKTYYYILWIVNYLKEKKKKKGNDLGLEIHYISYAYQKLCIEFKILYNTARSKIQERLTYGEHILEEAVYFNSQKEEAIQEFYAQLNENQKRILLPLSKMIDDLAMIVNRAKHKLQQLDIPIEKSFQLKSKEIYQHIEEAKNDDEIVKNSLELVYLNKQYRQNKIINFCLSISSDCEFFTVLLKKKNYFKTDRLTMG